MNKRVLEIVLAKTLSYVGNMTIQYHLRKLLRLQGMGHLFVVTLASTACVKDGVIELPKKPVRNRRTTKPGKLFTRDAGTHRTVNMNSVIMYGGFLPIAAILEIR